MRPAPPILCQAAATRNFATEAIKVHGQSRYLYRALFGARKPDAAVYRRCLAEIVVAPEETLFIDDSVANVAGARAAGVVGVSVC